jgi:hypothetical protein
MASEPKAESTSLSPQVERSGQVAGALLFDPRLGALGGVLSGAATGKRRYWLSCRPSAGYRDGSTDDLMLSHPAKDPPPIRLTAVDVRSGRSSASRDPDGGRRCAAAARGHSRGGPLHFRRRS